MVPVGAEPCENAQVPPKGVEPPPENPRKTQVSDEGGAKSGAPGARDPQLIADAWPRPPDVIKGRIVGMVEAVPAMGSP